MKKNVHPKYQKVLFVDSSTGHKFVCGTTLQCESTEVFEGKEYPVYYVSISSSSHPFFTGNKQLIDTEGRVDKFNKRYSAVGKKANQEPSEKKAKESKEPKEKRTKKV